MRNEFLVTASGLGGGLLPGKIAVYSSKTPENSHLTDTDNTIRNDLTGVDNDNKHTLLHDQDGQTWFCFLWIARIVRHVRQHKDAEPDLARYHYP